MTNLEGRVILRQRATHAAGRCPHRSRDHLPDSRSGWDATRLFPSRAGGGVRRIAARIGGRRGRLFGHHLGTHRAEDGVFWPCPD